jgi:NTP pyrophosphatase (non-canonical NTP hydrolase)
MSTTPEQEFFIAAWRTVAQESWDNAGDKGFWDGVLNIPAQLAGVHSEVSEILTALEHGDPESKKIPGFKCSEEEAADVVLRIMSIAEGAGWRVAEALVAKMQFNETRERLHGKKF